MDRPPPSIRVVSDPMDGAMDVQGGRISAGSPGGDGGGQEHSGGLQRVRAASGHGAQDAGPLRASWVSATDSAPASQPFDKLRRSPTPASSTGSWRMTSRAPESSATRPSGYSRASGTSTGSTADTRRSRTTSERIVARPGRCLSRCPMRRDTRSATLARPRWSLARGAEGPLFRNRPAPQRRLLRQGLPG